MARKMKDFVLIKDIVIPKGTVFRDASCDSVEYGSDVVCHTLGLTKDSHGDFYYCLEGAELEDGTLVLEDGLAEYFVELKE